MPVDIHTIPSEVLISYLSPYLKEVDSNAFFSTCKAFVPNLLMTRTITLWGNSWWRFCEEVDYRHCILELVGCIDPITKQEVAKRKLKLILRSPSTYWEDDLYMLTIAMTRTYQSFFYEVDVGYDMIAQQIVKSCQDIPSISTIMKCNLPVHHWKYLQHADIDQTNHVITNLDDIVNMSKAANTSNNTIHNDLICLQDLRGIQSIRFNQNMTMFKVLHLQTTLQFVEIQSETIHDLTPLFGVKRVLLHQCSLVVDLSPLVKAQKVEIVKGRGIVDFTPLSFVPEVTLKGFPQLIDVSIFATADVTTTSFTLVNCENVEDISMLHAMKKLDISDCIRIQKYPRPSGQGQMWTFRKQSISDLTGYDTLHSLTLSSCPQIQDVSMLGNLHSLDIYTCHNILHVDALCQVRNLTLAHCDRISDVSMLGKVQELWLNGCDNIKSIDGLKNLFGGGVPSKFRSERAKWFYAQNC